MWVNLRPHPSLQTSKNTERSIMNVFDSILVSINEVLGQFLHAGSSMSSTAALALGLF
jgi:hypothetical protein